MKEDTKNNKHYVWAFCLVMSVIMVCVTIYALNQNPYTIRFELDENARKAIESINYTEISQKELSCANTEQAVIDCSFNDSYVLVSIDYDKRELINISCRTHTTHHEYDLSEAWE